MIIPLSDKDCGIPSVPNGVVTGSTSQTVSPDSTLTVKCNAGYDLDATLDAADGVKDGSATIQCVRATVFNPVLPDPTCIPQVGRFFWHSSGFICQVTTFLFFLPSEVVCTYHFWKLMHSSLGLEGIKF